MATEPLFSATTLSDFSNTFQSLIVLSARRERCEVRQRAPFTAPGGRDEQCAACNKPQLYSIGAPLLCKPPALSPVPHTKVPAEENRQQEQLTVRRKQEVRCVLTLAPPDLVDLLLNLERLEVVELGLVALELRVELVLAALFRLVALEQDDAAALVACGEVVSSVVKLDRGCRRAIEYQRAKEAMSNEQVSGAQMMSASVMSSTSPCSRRRRCELQVYHINPRK